MVKMRDIAKFQVCICVVEKTSESGYEHIRFKNIILKFNDYADAMKYAKKMIGKCSFLGI